MKSLGLACIAVLLLLGFAESAAARPPQADRGVVCPCESASRSGGDDAAAKRRLQRQRKRAAAKRRRARLERKLRRDVGASSARVDDVIDGETLIVKITGPFKKTLPVHVLGIDTPQTNEDGDRDECGGQAATSLVFGLLFPKASDSDRDGLLDSPGGRSVPLRLTTDPRQPVYERDTGNLPAYVDVAAGARGRGSSAYDIARTVIASGYSRARTSKLTRARSYLLAETAARQTGKGLWTQCAGNFHAPL